MSEFKNQFCACSAQPEKKCESGSLFNTKMPAALQVREYILVRVTDTMFYSVIEEGDPIWNPMVSYFMQNDIDDNRTTSNDGGRIGNACDLAQSELLLDLRSERVSLFDLEATATSL